MAAAITMYRGTTKNIVVTVRDAKTKEPVDFTAGDKVIMTVKKEAKSPAVELRKTITALTGNTVTIPFAPVDTQELAPQAYQYDVQLIHAGGSVDMLVEPSVLTVKQSITDGDVE